MSAIIAWTLSIRTVSEANQRSHWAAKAKRVRDHRIAAKLLTLANRETLRRAWAALPGGLVVTIRRQAPSAGLDDDNLRSSAKAVRDGIADALGINDRDPRVRWVYCQGRGPYAVMCTIEAEQPTDRSLGT